MKKENLTRALDIYDCVFDDIFNTLNVQSEFCNDVCDCFIITVARNSNALANVVFQVNCFVNALNTDIKSDTFVMFSQAIDNDTLEFYVSTVRDFASELYPEISETIENL